MGEWLPFWVIKPVHAVYSCNGVLVSWFFFSHPVENMAKKSLQRTRIFFTHPRVFSSLVPAEVAVVVRLI